MKKIIVLSLVTVLVLSIGMISFADNSNDTPNWYKEMLKWEEAQINNSLKNGTITKQQAEIMKNQLNNMKNYNNQNGFNQSGYGFGSGMMWNYVPNMMGGFNSNQVNPNFNGSPRGYGYGYGCGWRY